MAFDGFVTRAVAYELDQSLIGSRIHKIYQPHSTDLLLNLRGFGKTHSLIISANPTYPRIHLTQKNYPNPTEPPMFCMLLRKHLEGGTIERIKQIDHERIIHIDIKVRDELGDLHTKRLIIEIMGRHSNIILLNPDTQQIFDGITHVSLNVSSYRQILPGKKYLSPPEQNKANPLTVTKEDFFSIIQFNEGKIDKQLVQSFTGMSPTISKELLYLAVLPTKENLWQVLSTWMDNVQKNNYQYAITSGEDKSDFSIFPLQHLGEQITTYPTIGECLDSYYNQKAERDTVRQKTLDLSRILLNEKSRNEKKITYLNDDILEAKGAEKYQLYGELLTAFLHQVKRGDQEIKVPNYYDSDSELVIPLDPLKTPSENAQQYFKKYSKLKISLDYINQQLIKTKSEIEYLEGIISQLETANVHDVEDIREELIEQGYLRIRSRHQHKKKQAPSPSLFLSSEGQTIYVGKNNKQNDYLTNRIAGPMDTWLHTKDIPGSHVVIKGKDYGEKTLIEAAMLAAFFSKAKNSSQVPVDYTLIKHVKKPSGARPGYVIYDNQKTLYVTPDESLADRLIKK